MSKNLRVFLLVFGGVSILLLGLSLYVVLSTRSFLNSDEKTRGKVVDFIESVDTEGDVTYAPIVVYKTVTGEQMIYASSQYSYPAAYEENELVDVYYDRTKPNSERLSGIFSLWGGAIITGILGLIFGIAPLLIYRSIRKERKRKELISSK